MYPGSSMNEDRRVLIVDLAWNQMRFELFDFQRYQTIPRLGFWLGQSWRVSEEGIYYILFRQDLNFVPLPQTTTWYQWEYRMGLSRISSFLIDYCRPRLEHVINQLDINPCSPYQTLCSWFSQKLFLCLGIRLLRPYSSSYRVLGI